jgi:hypothetical protein
MEHYGGIDGKREHLRCRRERATSVPAGDPYRLRQGGGHDRFSGADLRNLIKSTMPPGEVR